MASLGFKVAQKGIWCTRHGELPDTGGSPNFGAMGSLPPKDPSFGAFCLDVGTSSFFFANEWVFRIKPLSHKKLVTFSRASQVAQLSHIRIYVLVLELGSFSESQNSHPGPSCPKREAAATQNLGTWGSSLGFSGVSTGSQGRAISGLPP